LGQHGPMHRDLLPDGCLIVCKVRDVGKKDRSMQEVFWREGLEFTICDLRETAVDCWVCNDIDFVVISTASQ